MLAALCSASLAQSSDSKSNWYISFFVGRSARIFGTEDIRTDFGLGVSWQRPEPHFKWRHGPAQLVMEGYYEHSSGRDHGTRGKLTDAIGVIWYARFRFNSRGLNLFLDLGEGAQLSNSESFDLGTRFNSSPMLGFGVAIKQGHQETLVGVRYLHLSNANLNVDNRGQNQFLIYTAVKF